MRNEIESAPGGSEFEPEYQTKKENLKKIDGLPEQLGFNETEKLKIIKKQAAEILN